MSHAAQARRLKYHVASLETMTRFVLATLALGSGVYTYLGVRSLLDGEESTVVQLLAPLSEDSTIGKYISKNKNMIQQVCYRTYNLDKTIATLKERGAVFTGEPSIGTAGSRVIFLHPKYTGGLLIEITEPPAGGMPYKD